MIEIYGFVSVGIEGRRDEHFLADHISIAIEHDRFSCREVGIEYFSRWNVYSKRSADHEVVTTGIAEYLKGNGFYFQDSALSHKKVSISLYEKTESCGLVIPSELALQIGNYGFNLEVVHYGMDI